MAVPQIKGSLLTNSAEAHFSAAAVHLDFSIVKVQPYEEYRDIGRSLSARRRVEADEGQPHVTAFQLGRLFSNLVPAIPNLIRAFGIRCSELANSPVFNPQGTSKHGLFANDVGLDSTSVWAAATSGDAAIAVLLLACMLSSMWDPSAAISIWMELIAERRKVLEASGNPWDHLTSKNISLTRDQVAAWHTSAHAWRLTADEANARRHNQLLLIVNNLGIPVNLKLSLSESVIAAWQTAMVTVDQLVAGNPLSIETGAPLVGLAAWHLYPDMLVYHPGKYGKPVDILQNDPLVQHGGKLTLGIQDARRKGDGIYWSLPLAHLRYYGQPVQAEALLSSRTSRYSIEDLMLVALGSVIRRWCASAEDIELALSLIVRLDEFVDIPSLEQDHGWLTLLARSAESFVTPTDDDKSHKLQLIRCGQRRCPRFVDDPKSDSILGLSNPKTFLRLLPNNVARVELLRNVARDFSDSRYFMVIQCKTDFNHLSWELSSVDKLRSVHKRRFEDDAEAQDQQHPQRYIRWVNADHADLDDKNVPSDTESVRFAPSVVIPWLWAPQGPQWQNAPRAFYTHLLQESSDKHWKHARGATVLSQTIFGDPEIAALYAIDIAYWTHSTPNDRPKVVRHNPYRELPNIFVVKHVAWALERNLPSREALYSHLSEGHFSSDMLKSLKALLSVSTLYAGLGKASVELKVAREPLRDHAWIPAINKDSSKDPFNAVPLNREESFACIARFESGSFNLHPSAMDRVLAISSGNSIFVARCLLQDPCGPQSSTAIERIVGNLGKTGMSFLLCPDIPDVRSESNDAQLVPHLPFDLAEEDSFSQTSLHLSFTGWEQPINVGSKGNRDVEASYVEAAIGLYDRGKWVADLNILDIFKHRSSRLMNTCFNYHANRECREELCKYVSIDSWEELLDSPIEVGVVRARGNWQARLAAAALAIQRGHETRIIPDRVCWPCFIRLPKLSYRPDRSDVHGRYEEEEVFGAFPHYLEEEGSDSETEETVQAALKQEKRFVSQIRISDLLADNDDAYENQSDKNVVYIL